MTTSSGSRPPGETLDSFETELLALLRQEVGHRAVHPARPPLAPSATKPGQRDRRPRPLLVAAAAAVATGAALVLPVSSPSPAYAVHQAGDGTVTVTISRLEDAAGLERAFAAKGIRAKVDFLPYGQICDPSRLTPSSAPLTLFTTFTEAGATFDVSPDALGPDQTLVVETSSGSALDAGVDQSSIGVSIAQGPVGVCRPMEFPDDVKRS